MDMLILILSCFIGHMFLLVFLLLLAPITASLLCGKTTMCITVMRLVFPLKQVQVMCDEVECYGMIVLIIDITIAQWLIL